jgi:hypothetical protein
MSSDAFQMYKDIRIELRPRELPKGGWVVDVILHRDDHEVGTKYQVKTIYSTRMEAEVSGLALAHGIIDREL